MERRIVDLQTFDGVVAEVERLHQGGYQKTGVWDLSEILSHCGQVIEQTMDGFDFSAPWFFRLIRPLMKSMIFKIREYLTLSFFTDETINFKISAISRVIIIKVINPPANDETWHFQRYVSPHPKYHQMSLSPLVYS